MAWPAEDLDEDLPEAPRRPKTKPGDVWALGRHRLICADATDSASYQALIGKAKAQLLWTDPPYGVSYTGKTAQALIIHNDGTEGLDQLLADSFAAVDAHLAAGARLYVAHPAGALSAEVHPGLSRSSQPEGEDGPSQRSCGSWRLLGLPARDRSGAMRRVPSLQDVASPGH